MNNLTQIISNSLINYKGYKTNRRIIVFESDDWGSIRMPSNEVFIKLKQAGINVDKSVYCKYDSLESNSDIEHLFEILIKYKDEKGNHPVITANTVVANPDFEKIKNAQFKEYYYEPFSETLKKYPNHDKVIDYYKLGINKGIFYPQFHGREHVNVELWFQLLKENNLAFKLAFENNMWGLSTDVFPSMKKSIQATFDSNNNDFLEESIRSGLILFEQLFGYKSESFIANNFIWNSALNKTLIYNGIKYLQGMKYQLLPKLNNEKRLFKRHYLGEVNDLKQYYNIRNCSFEPSIDNSDFNKTLFEISNAFFWNKPAIISTHRINFIGSISQKNRDDNLKQFDKLLTNIIKKWPNIEFMNTAMFCKSFL
ncbi:MAG: hypothetical protein ACOVSR_05465 [Bacteroidia bacterium]